MPLLPREHGAYGQLTFPIATAFAVSGFTVPASAVAAVAVAGFLMHEPAKVMLGQRGARASRERGREAVLWLAVWVAVMVVAGLVTFATTPPTMRWSLLVPALPASVLAAATFKNREKSPSGEVASALAFSGVAVPMVLLAGAPLISGMAIAVPFALLFVSGTLAVRVVILRVRGGGDVRAMAATRQVVMWLAAGAAIALMWAVGVNVLPFSVLLAAAPGLAVAVAVAARPPSPARLRALGWTLVTVSLVTAAITIAAARL